MHERMLTSLSSIGVSKVRGHSEKKTAAFAFSQNFVNMDDKHQLEELQHEDMSMRQDPADRLRKL